MPLEPTIQGLLLPMDDSRTNLRAYRGQSRAAQAHPWESLSLVLFLLTTAVLFIRPTELFPSLEVPHLYELLISATVLAWLATVRENRSIGRILTGPIGVCVLVMLPAALMSNLVHGRTWEARFDTLEFSKRIVYFVLLVGIINTPTRLKIFLKWMTIFITVLTALAVLQYHHLIPNIEALQQFQESHGDDIDPATGEPVTLVRLCGAGIFNDPNDLCLILMLGGMCCIYWVRDARYRGYHLIWTLPAALFAYSIYLTHSRGGFMAMLIGVAVLLVSRIGWKKAALIYAILLPAFFVIFSGRQTEISTEQETANQRIQLWSAGLQMFKSSPVFGVGMNKFAEQAGLVAHNSFLHCFAELGFFGGTIFLGAFVYCVYSLVRLGRTGPHQSDPLIQNFRPYLLAALAAYFVGYMTLSRPYVEPTYLMLALVAVYLDFAGDFDPHSVRRLSYRMVGWGIAASAVFVMGEYLFVRVFAHWS